MKPGFERDIRSAVKDYVDQLIQERTGAGRGMAVSSHDLMAAARLAGQNTYMADMSSSYLKPGTQLLQTFSDVPADRVTTRRDGGKGSRKPMDNRGYKPPSGPKREPHWLTWKTGNTPVPEEFVPRSPSSVVRPGTAASMAARTATPACGLPYREQTPNVEIIDLAPQETGYRPPSVAAYRPPSVVSRPLSAVSSVEPPAARTPTAGARPPGAAFRNLTPGPGRIQTPAALDVRQADVCDTNNNPYPPKPTRSNNPAYMPALKSWFSEADEYERDVAYNLMQILSSSNGAPGHAPHPHPRARSAAPPALGRLAAGTRRNVPRTAGVVTSRPAWQHLYADTGPDQYVTSSVPDPEVFYRAPVRQQNPRARYHKYKPDPTHQAACFTNSQLPYRSSFTINPEWVSEVKMWKNPHQGKPKKAFTAK